MKGKLSAALALMLLLSGCSYSSEVNEKAYVIAIGIDRGENHMLKASFLFAYPDGSASEDGSGGGKKEKDLVSVEAPTVYSALRMLNTFKSKQIDINHTMLIAISQKLAEKEGISSLVTDFVNTRGFRPSVYVCVSQADTDKLFKKMEPKQDIFIEKYIERLFSKAANNDVSEAYLYNCYFNCVSQNGGGLLPLVGLTDEDGAQKETENYPYEKADDFALNYTAREIPLDGDSSAALCGYAAFRGGKMVGTLGMMESNLVNIIEENMPCEHFSALVPEKNRYAGVSLRQTAPVKVTVKTGEIPEISLDIRLWGEFTGVDGLFKTEEEYNSFSRYLNSAFTQKVNDLIYRTQKEFGADVLRFGAEAKGNFLTNRQWESYNWKERYKTAVVRVRVSVDISDYGELR